MTIKNIACASTIVCLSSLLQIGSLTPVAFAETTEASLTKSEQTGEGLRQGLPGRRLGGGTRQGGQIFRSKDSHLAALTPSNNLSVTTAERPTLMFYVPAMVTEQTGELVIRNAQDNVVYESSFQIDSEGDVVSFDTARNETMPALTLNETYSWFFSIIPEATERASDIVVHGNIRRVDREAWISQQSIDSAEIAGLSEVNPLMQARMLYQQANLWHDAALILDELRQSNPTDAVIASEWEQLIALAGLAAVVEVSETTVQTDLN